MIKSIWFPHYETRIFNHAAACLNGNCAEQARLQEILFGLAMLPRAYNKAVEVIEGEIQNAIFYAKTGVSSEEIEQSAEAEGFNDDVDITPECSSIEFNYLNDNDREQSKRIERNCAAIFEPFLTAGFEGIVELAIREPSIFENVPDEYRAQILQTAIRYLMEIDSSLANDENSVTLALLYPVQL